MGSCSPAPCCTRSADRTALRRLASPSWTVHANAHTWRTKYEILRDDSVDREGELTRLKTAQAVLRAQADTLGRAKDVLAHSEVAGDDVRGEGNSKRDPGAGFSWARFWGWVDTWETEFTRAGAAPVNESTGPSNTGLSAGKPEPARSP